MPLVVSGVRKLRKHNAVSPRNREDGNPFGWSESSCDLPIGCNKCPQKQRLCFALGEVKK